MIKLLQQISLWVDTVVEKLLLAIGGSICLILFGQVIFRNLGASLGWSEEVSRHLLVAITFLSATATYKRMSFIRHKGIGHSLRRILSGIVTVTEAAALAVFYALLVSMVFNRKLKWQDIS